MKIIIESTDQLTNIDGIPVRIWEGVTEAGTRCKVMIHRLAVHNDEDASQFEAELKAQMPPRRYIPLSMVL